jgi:membrane protease subunit (stomatin/prohibitin family)
VSLFEGHHDSGLQRLFIEMPDDAKDRLAWKWPDQQIIQHSQLNVDLDYQAVFTNLGKVIGVMGPGRYHLDQGASLALGWLVDRLTGDAYYDTEIYFVATRERANVQFGGPVDSLTDGPTGLVVTLRVFGELAFKVIDPVALLGKLIGTGAQGDFDTEIATWVTDQTLAAVRAVLPDIVAAHGVLAMGQLQDATAHAALAKVNEALAGYGLGVTAFGELNVNLPDADAQELKRFAATKAYAGLAGSFDGAVRGQAALEIAGGIANGHVGVQEGIVAGMMMGIPVAPSAAAAGAPAPGGAGPGSAGASVAAPPAAVGPGAAGSAPAGSAPAGSAPAGSAPAGSAPAGSAPAASAPVGAPSAEAPATAASAHFCSQCGTALAGGVHYCPNCGAAVMAA